METKIIDISINDADFSEKINTAASVIKNGGLVVFPTETVYGLGADATNAKAAKAIYAAKGRPSDNPLIIHISTPTDAEKYTYTSETYYRLAEAFMPGPLTVILPAKDTVPKETRGGLDTVAVRCPEHKIANALISAAGVPIAAPSANLSGSPSPTTAEHVIDDMMGRVDVILSGGSADFGLESTIVKIEDDNSLLLLRPGKITVDELLSIADVTVADSVTNELKKGEIALSPGMKYRHYAPKSPLILFDATKEALIEHLKKESNLNLAIIAYNEDISAFTTAFPKAHCYDFGSREDLDSHAFTLFSILRDADKQNFDKIYAPLPGKEGIELALYNRMIRAAAHEIIKL